MMQTHKNYQIFSMTASFSLKNSACLFSVYLKPTSGRNQNTIFGEVVLAFALILNV